MALSATQKSDIRDLLGWPARFHDDDGRLERAFSALEALPTDETLIASLLTKAKDLEMRITDALGRIKVSSAGSITLNPAEISMLRAEGRRCVNRMAAILGVEVKQHSFGGGTGGGPLQTA